MSEEFGMPKKTKPVPQPARPISTADSGNQKPPSPK